MYEIIAYSYVIILLPIIPAVSSLEGLRRNSGYHIRIFSLTRRDLKLKILLIGITISIFTLGSGCRNTGKSPPKNRTQMIAYSPYWYVDDQTDSIIEVKNLLDSTLTLIPVIKTLEGQSIELGALKIPPRSTSKLNLKPRLQLKRGGKAPERWGDGSRPNSLLGSTELKVISPKRADASSFSAWVVVKNRKEGLGLVSPFHRVDINKRIGKALW